MRSGIAIAALAGLISAAACGSSDSYKEEESMLYRVDRAHGRAWRLGMAGVLVRERDGTRETLVELPGWVVARDGCLPSIAVGPKGEVVVTSNVISTLWRIDPETLAVSAHALRLSADRDKDVGFVDLTFASAYGAYFAVSTIDGSVWKIDGSLSRAERMTPSAQPIAKLERSTSCAIN